VKNLQRIYIKLEQKVPKAGHFAQDCNDKGFTKNYLCSKQQTKTGRNMKFVFLCDANYLKGDMVNFVNNFPTNHELVTMTSDELLQTKSIFEGTFAVLAERTTWQKNFSLFRYFGLLPLLEVLPLGIVSRSRRSEPLKGRTQNKNQEIYFNPSSSAEELYLQVDKFVAAPPAGFTYPRGSQKA
jgi:hypothetical protein